MSRKQRTHRTSETLAFKAKDFHHHSKNQFWYIGISILLLGLLVLAIRFGEYLLAGVIVAAGIAIFRVGNLKPQEKDIKLTEKGVYWGDRFFGYHQLRSFWATSHEGTITLYLDRLNLAPTISFIIPSNRLDEAMEFLSFYLPYHSHRGEPVTDRLSRLLRI